MKFRVDLNLSPRLAARLLECGHDAVHGMELGLVSSPDEDVLSRARDDERVVISADSDFGTILAATRAETPSVIYIRRASGRRVEQLVDLVVGNLDLLEEALLAGSIEMLGAGTARIRRLPIL